MDSLRQWALCIIIASAAGTLVCALSPSGSVDKTLRTVVGIFVISTICIPLTELKTQGIFEPAFAEITEVTDNGSELRSLMLSTCVSALEDEVFRISEKNAVTVRSVTVDAYVDSDLCINIQKIQVKIHGEDNKNVSDTVSELEEIFAVPIEVIG